MKCCPELCLMALDAFPLEPKYPSISAITPHPGRFLIERARYKCAIKLRRHDLCGRLSHLMHDQTAGRSTATTPYCRLFFIRSSTGLLLNEADMEFLLLLRMRALVPLGRIKHTHAGSPSHSTISHSRFYSRVEKQRREMYDEKEPDGFNYLPVRQLLPLASSSSSSSSSSASGPSDDD